MRLPATLLYLISCLTLAYANTEKTIFIGPARVHIPTNARPDFYDLNLEVLTPSTSTIRKHLQVVFPKADAEKGEQTWYLLDGLEPGRRYELRICWAATQPTQFWLHTHSITEVFDSPNSIASLAQYSESRLNRKDTLDLALGSSQSSRHSGPAEKSILFLQVFAAADFYSSNQSLMNSPPPVYVDLILDPYLWNILPRSLLPTAAYIVVVSLGSWFFSGYIWRWIIDQTSSQASKPHKD